MTDGIAWIKPGQTILSVTEDQRGPAMQALIDRLDAVLATEERPETIRIGQPLYDAVCAEYGIPGFRETTFNHPTRGVITFTVVPTPGEPDAPAELPQ